MMPLSPKAIRACAPPFLGSLSSMSGTLIGMLRPRFTTRRLHGSMQQCRRTPQSGRQERQLQQLMSSTTTYTPEKGRGAAEGQPRLNRSPVAVGHRQVVASGDDRVRQREASPASAALNHLVERGQIKLADRDTARGEVELVWHLLTARPVKRTRRRTRRRAQRGDTAQQQQRSTGMVVAAAACPTVPSA